jgi:hypothetical protein
VGSEERLGWLFADVEADYLDPSNEYDRESLIHLQHPELEEALSDPGVDEIEVAGQPMNPRLHIALHQGVAEQIVNDEPPEVWQTALRLEALGYGRHEVLHMVASVLSGEVWQVMAEQQPYDRERHLAALAALPASWEAMRPRRSSLGGWTSRGRRAGGRRRRKGRGR